MNGFNCQIAAGKSAIEPTCWKYVTAVGKVAEISGEDIYRKAMHFGGGFENLEFGRNRRFCDYHIDSGVGQTIAGVSADFQSGRR